MALQLNLPQQDRRIVPYRLTGLPMSSPSVTPTFNRIAYAAAHVVADPLRDRAIDWESTLQFRHHLWRLGFKIAEAMDTSQRGMGLDWAGAQELIGRSLSEAKSLAGADLACGAGTDQLLRAQSLEDVIGAYEEQVGFVEKNGGRVILMASRALAGVAKHADDYAKVYGRIVQQAQDKVILHWLGPMFDPALSSYWGSDDFPTALDCVLEIIEENRSKVDGVKISLLDSAREIELRNRLPDGVVCYTGDDFNYAELIEGDGMRHSHALLGIFDAIAPQASAALSALAIENTDKFRQILAPTVPLSRKIFEAPTQYYKAGVVFLAWLNGHQSHFVMPAAMQAARGIIHYSQIFRLADQANVLDKPELAIARMKTLLSMHGFHA